jgi:hypothetical protein
MMLQFLSLSVNYTCHAMGHFSHSQCMKSKLPNILGNPKAEFMPIYLFKFARVGWYKYCNSKQLCTALQNLFMASKAVLSVRQQYSSVAFATPPYASILIAAVHF